MSKKTHAAPASPEPAPQPATVTASDATAVEAQVELNPPAAEREFSPPKLLERIFSVRILPCPRFDVRAKTPEAAEAIYRERFGVKREDLVAEIEEVPSGDDRYRRGPSATRL